MEKLYRVKPQLQKARLIQKVGNLLVNFGSEGAFKRVIAETKDSAEYTQNIRMATQQDFKDVLGVVDGVQTRNCNLFETYTIEDDKAREAQELAEIERIKTELKAQDDHKTKVVKATKAIAAKKESTDKTVSV